MVLDAPAGGGDASSVPPLRSHIISSKSVFIIAWQGFRFMAEEVSVSSLYAVRGFLLSSPQLKRSFKLAFSFSLCKTIGNNSQCPSLGQNFMRERTDSLEYFCLKTVGLVPSASKILPSFWILS